VYQTHEHTSYAHITMHGLRMRVLRIVRSVIIKWVCGEGGGGVSDGKSFAETEPDATFQRYVFESSWWTRVGVCVCVCVCVYV